MKDNNNNTNNSRRKFLGQASCAAIGSTTLFSTLFNLKAVNAAVANNSSITNNPSDYKALVCILLEGGMDSYNMLVPRSQPQYSQYAATRSNLALPLSSLLPINQLTPDGSEYGLHPNLPSMRNMFNNGNLSFVTNIGSLINPVSKSQYLNGTATLPLGLYSHSDQIMHWQTGTPHLRNAVGWGGRIADMMVAANENQTISMNTSLSGSNLFQSGNNSVEYSLHPYGGAISIDGYQGDWSYNMMRTAALDGMINANYQNAFKKTYASTIKTSIEGGNMYRAVLDNAPTFTTPFPTFVNNGGANNFSQGLQMIAKSISGQQSLGMNRQIFFISYGGWDHHDYLLENQSTMLAALDSSLNSFNEALTQLGVQDKVTTFSLSEFSRTLTSNGDGTDHAWGGNTFVMGGAVNGQNIYGDYPSLVLGSSNTQEVYGTLIPTTSADQYFRDIALWYGVSPSEISTLFPNIGNFSASPLGFI
jgi:uncharacterized protein (DUF1501 family)